MTKQSKKKSVPKKKATPKKSDLSAGVYSNTMSGQIQKYLAAGKTDKQIRALVKKRFPEIEDPKRKNYISWCRHYMKKRGVLKENGDDTQ